MSLGHSQKESHNCRTCVLRIVMQITSRWKEFLLPPLWYKILNSGDVNSTRKSFFVRCLFCYTSAFFCEFCLQCPRPRHFFNFHCSPSLVKLSPKLSAYLVQQLQLQQPNERFHWLFVFVDWFTTIFIPSLYKMSPFNFDFRHEFLIWNITSHSNIYICRTI